MDYFTDEALDALVAEHAAGLPVNLTMLRSIELLKHIADPAQRERAYGEASTLSNLMGGTTRSWMWTAVQDVIAVGPDGETYGERTNRHFLEQQAQRRSHEQAAARTIALSRQAGLR